MSEIVSPVGQPASALEPVTETKTVTPATVTQTQDPAAAAPAEQPAEGSAEEPARDPSTGRFTKRTEQLQAQVSRLTEQKHRFSAEVTALEERAKQLKAQLAAPTNIDPSDYSAQTTHDMKRAVKEERLDQTEEDMKFLRHQTHQIRKATFAAKVEAVRDRIPDIDTALSSFAKLTITNDMADLIADSEKAAEIAYYLAKNPQEAEALAMMPPHAMGRAIGQIESRVSAPVRNRLSQAPAPVQTVSGGSGSVAIDLNTTDFASYEKARIAQINAAG
jgi:hypothetical protein